MSSDVYANIQTLRGEVTDDSFALLAAGKALADGLGVKLTAVLLGHGCEEVLPKLGAADEVICVDHPALADFNPEAHLRVLAGLAKEDPPRVFLFGQDAMGTDLACSVALELGASLVSSCHTVGAEDGKLSFVSITCGGKMLAEGEMSDSCTVALLMPGGYKPEAGQVAGSPSVRKVDSPVALDDLRTRVVEYHEPEAGDVDISREPILISVGRGIQQEDNLSLVHDLAHALGGEVAGSRPVVDQGWLPTTRMVGKSGKRVKPKLYLALGISGSPEHLEGVPDFETMVAVNTDEKAPIFDVADHGTTVDVMDLLPVLTDKVKGSAGK